MTQEEKWIKAIKKNSNEEAANQLIQKYYQEIFGFVYKQTLDQEFTKDLTQEIFISVLRSIQNFDGRASFRTWLYKVANSRMIDYYRSKYYKQNRKTESIDEKQVYESVEFMWELETKEEVNQVLELMSRFQYDIQQIVRLKIYADYTFTEIAASLEIPESTVKTKYYGTLRKLQKLVKENEDE